MAPTVLSPLQQAVSTAIVLALAAGACVVYARLVARLRTEGGRVRVAGLEFPDLLVSFVLGNLFGGLVLYSITAAKDPAAPPPTAEHVLPNSLWLLAFIFALGLFLAFRGLRLTELFGLARVSILQVCGWAVLLLVASFPFVGVANAITVYLLKNQVERQPLVELFSSAAQAGDFSTVAKIALSAVVIAPLCEEFLFRGYFYAVGKRFTRAWISGLFTAALFGAFHANVASFGGLFVLAIALTLAYERTGSLAVPVTMHALFNATSLGVLYLQATGRLPQ